MQIPHTTERRPDTGVNNVTMGIWLFIASEVMLFGGLFSAYALLRVSATDWPSGNEVLSLPLGLGNTFVLALVTGCAARARNRAPAGARHWLVVSAVFGTVFLALKALEYWGEFARGLRPADSTFLGLYFVLTGLHAAHVIGGIVANLWVAASAGRVQDAVLAGRSQSLAIYWLFVDVVWLVILVLMYLL